MDAMIPGVEPDPTRYPEFADFLAFGFDHEAAAALQILADTDRETYRRIVAGETPEHEPLLMPWQYWEICAQFAADNLVALPAASDAVN